MDEVVLAVLQHGGLVVEPSERAHAFALWLRVLVRVLDLLVALLHVTRADGLDLLVQRPAEHVLDVLDVESRALASMTLRRVALALGAREAVHEVLIQLMAIRVRLLVAVALVVKVLLELLVRQVEARAVRHVHLEAP